MLLNDVVASYDCANREYEKRNQEKGLSGV
jgi:hypothetical protein